MATVENKLAKLRRELEKELEHHLEEAKANAAQTVERALQESAYTAINVILGLRRGYNTTWELDYTRPLAKEVSARAMSAITTRLDGWLAEIDRGQGDFVKIIPKLQKFYKQELAEAVEEQGRKAVRLIAQDDAKKIVDGLLLSLAQEAGTDDE